MTTIHNGDCIEIMNQMPAESVDAIVTDPPYGLSSTDPGSVADTITKWAGGDRDHVPTGRGFMGKSWDAFVPPPAVWDECLRVLKPGGHMVVFAGSRTQDLMGLSIRLAGFEIRDSMAWLYGSGFPKSMNVGKAIDKAAGAEREVVGTKLGQPGYSLAPSTGGNLYEGSFGGTGDPIKEAQITAPATPEAAQWDGWGTSLKPGHEPIVLARKPLAEKTVARNVLAHGTGAINVDACRVATDENLNGGGYSDTATTGTFLLGGAGSVDELRALAEVGANTPDGRNTAAAALARALTSKERTGEYVQPSGRWPANVLLDHHAAAWVDEQSGVQRDGVAVNRNKNPDIERPHTVYGGGWMNDDRPDITYGGGGGASRFFYSIREDITCQIPDPASTAGSTTWPGSSPSVTRPRRGCGPFGTWWTGTRRRPARSGR